MAQALSIPVQSDGLYGTAGISIAFCVIALLYSAWIRWRHQHLTERFSFKLAIVLLVGNAVYAATLISVQASLSDELRCIASMLFLIASELVCVFTTGAIAANLLLVVVINWQKGGEALEKVHLVGIMAISTTIPMIGLGTSSFGMMDGECWFSGGTDSKIFGTEWAFLYSWIALCAIFSTAGSLFVWGTNFRQRNSQRPSTAGPVIEESPSANSSANQMQGLHPSDFDALNCLSDEYLFRNSAARIAIYCVIPFICQACNIALDCALFLRRNNGASVRVWGSWLAFFANITSGSQGTITSIVFLILDPAIMSIRADYRRTLIGTYILPYVKVPKRPRRGEPQAFRRWIRARIFPRASFLVPLPPDRTTRLRFWAVWCTCVTERELRIVESLYKEGDGTDGARSMKNNQKRLSRL
ncbi:hypothetical protein BDZ88DRAFT_431242 [Geranomyces variabilis]|nr:hypothetical protein BDZ88DRAFT_431242 [Geranomyces variabilis]